MTIRLYCRSSLRLAERTINTSAVSLSVLSTLTGPLSPKTRKVDRGLSVYLRRISSRNGRSYFFTSVASIVTVRSLASFWIVSSAIPDALSEA
jgi:hypothetical protein